MAGIDEIRLWLEDGVARRASHMIVVCDTFDYEDYPVFVNHDQDAKAIAKTYNRKKKHRLMGVYNLSMDFTEQIRQRRPLNY